MPFISMPFFRDRSEEKKTYMGRYEGLLPWLEARWRETASEALMEELETYRVDDECASCKGMRLRPEALNVKVHGYGIGDFVSMPIDELSSVVEKLSLSEGEENIVHQVLIETKKRLRFLSDVGVGYLSLIRRSDTLSGGESQRIRLNTQSRPGNRPASSGDQTSPVGRRLTSTAPRGSPAPILARTTWRPRGVPPLPLISPAPRAAVDTG